MDRLNGYVGLTDPDWYAFLRRQPRVDEVNFWQPHGSRAFRVLKRGELFFFKLRAPQRAIAGFGFFERYESMSAWTAWDCFGPMNGAPDFGMMVDRICRLRGERDERAMAGEFEIGCIMLSAPFFFEPDQWVKPPRDWARTGIQTGKSYDLATGEGLRIREECLHRASRAATWNVDRPAADEPARYGAPYLVAPRLGQGLFSLRVRDAYEGACAITGEHSMPALEAAHIKPYARGGKHEVANGLFLRRDVHRLYDRGYVTVTPDYEFHVGERLRDEFKNGRSYYGLKGTKIALPRRAEDRPDRDLLAWHATQYFKG